MPLLGTKTWNSRAILIDCTAFSFSCLWSPHGVYAIGADANRLAFLSNGAARCS